ncbi:hypothetical protein HYQ46_002129 [Verticillium longisporum]|nr:hypothetical protein HYQ46_002129 [Verticillium longisporum]
MWRVWDGKGGGMGDLVRRRFVVGSVGGGRDAGGGREERCRYPRLVTPTCQNGAGRHTIKSSKVVVVLLDDSGKRGEGE